MQNAQKTRLKINIIDEKEKACFFEKNKLGINEKVRYNNNRNLHEDGG